MIKQIIQTTNLIKNEYLNSERDWYLGFSGGKDSTALLILVYLAIKDITQKDKKINVVYCDTGVEIPLVHQNTIKNLQNLQNDCSKKALPFNVIFAKPEINDSFFVNVIGKGYPPPTNRFRWCTRRLRIDPVKNAFSQETDTKKLILLGTRNGESQQRDIILKNNSTDNQFYFHQNNIRDTIIFSPIVNYETADIWSVIQKDYLPSIIDYKKMMGLYNIDDFENPIIKKQNFSPYGNSRFGCWTCTVVRKDRAVRSLVDQGYNDLKPLLEFRNWLSIMRDDPCNRCKKRRNGATGLGPITLKGREKILEYLLQTQKESGFNLISNNELSEIYKYWNADKISNKYNEI